MAVRFIHTSDWQIGKVFRFVDSSTMGLLQEARLRAITRLGEHAIEQNVSHILVAGDVYDMEALTPRSLGQPLERMRSFGSVAWHLLPGNHDPHRPNGLWDQLLRRELPPNVRLHLAAEPFVVEGEALALLPAPLHHKRTTQDPTAYMDGVGLPADTIRVGLAHGTVRGFGSEDRDVYNFIQPDRPELAGLDYLALGDWHGKKKINARCWYSGTPEIDAFDVLDGGQALLVEIEGRGAPPKVTPLKVGHYQWLTLHAALSNAEDIDFLEAKLRELGQGLERHLVHLRVKGALSLELRRYFEERIVESVSAALCVLRIDDSGLLPQPTAEDLDQIDRGGFVRAAAEVLSEKAAQGGEEARLAAEALQRLYIEHMKLQAEQR